MLQFGHGTEAVESLNTWQAPIRINKHHHGLKVPDDLDGPASGEGNPLAVGRPRRFAVEALAGGEQRHGAAAARASPDLSLVGKRDGLAVWRQPRLDRPEGPGQ